MKSALTWFQIPTHDLQRAREFFETVMGYTFTPAPQDPNSLLFPFTSPGVGGALVSRPQMKPGSSGCAVFLQLDGSTAEAQARVELAGGKVIRGMMSIPGVPGTMFVLEDTEGNHVGVHGDLS